MDCIVFFMRFPFDYSSFSRPTTRNIVATLRSKNRNLQGSHVYVGKREMACEMVSHLKFIFVAAFAI